MVFIAGFIDGLEMNQSFDFYKKNLYVSILYIVIYLLYIRIYI